MPLTPRDIPSIEVLRHHPDAAALSGAFGAEAALDALRDAAGAWRQRLAGATTGVESREALAAEIIRTATAAVRGRMRGSLRRVINATGVIVHTNLGRAPLAEAAVERIAEVARGYVNLEYDLDAGGRGRRDVHAEALLRALTGAEAAVVVNNNAAATMLVLSALASGREVIISRGELVEIGGGFRVPDILRQSGAILREVGTTNRTRVADYAAAFSDRTAAVLRVHPSNFRMDGFVERPDTAQLIAAARRFGILAIEDLGSGNVLGEGLGLTPAQRGGMNLAAIEEPTVRGSLEAGYDVVSVSGDKLLGGPQAGIILGRADVVDRIRRHPLMRAVRVDKLTYAALEATLLEHLGGRARETVPVARMIAMPIDDLSARAAALASACGALPGVRAEVVDGESTIGGGSAPGSSLPTRLVSIRLAYLSADALDARLRHGSPAVVARILDDRLVLDPRTIDPAEDDEVIAAIAAAVAADSD